jgi:elongation factor Ts
MTVAEGALGSYLHNAIAPGLGKIGVLVGLESKGDAGKLDPVARQLAMHVAAANPLAVAREGLDPALVERERKVLSEQARTSGKAEDIVAKMVEGRLRKFYEEVCLLDQTYVIDGESKVHAIVDKAGKEAGAAAKVAAFVRFQLGEGIEKEQADFASEVAAAAGKG